MAGFVEFFYNIIPGGTFLIALYLTPGIEKIIPKHEIDPNSLSVGTLFVLLSLFLGFAFQMINKFAPWMKNLHKLAIKDIAKAPDYQTAQDRIKRLIGRKITVNKKSTPNLKDEPAFYFMHDYLLSNKPNKILDLFHARISLWANIMTASVIYCVMLIIISLNPLITLKDTVDYPVLFILALILFGGCLIATRKSHEAFYDTVLKTFLVTTRKL